MKNEIIQQFFKGPRDQYTQIGALLHSRATLRSFAVMAAREREILQLLDPLMLGHVVK